jgi:glyoxylase-like metal-dependent hydrolase (beta-lactamase superfamily II)
VRIHAIQTGEVRVRERMMRGIRGPLRRAAMFNGPWTDWIPILAWAIEHDDGVIVVDTGERADVRDAPFAQFRVQPGEQLGARLRALDIDPGSVATVAMTHLHGDHMNGLVDLPNARLVLSEPEARAAASPMGRATQRLTHQPLPANYDPHPVTFGDPAVGAFAASHRLTADGRVLLVPAPGHTPGHSAVLVLEDDHHVLISGDTAYSVEQLRERHPDAVSPKAAVSIATMETILRHAAQQPTVVLPSHDPRSAERLAARTPLTV